MPSCWGLGKPFAASPGWDSGSQEFWHQAEKKAILGLSTDLAQEEAQSQVQGLGAAG